MAADRRIDELRAAARNVRAKLVALPEGGSAQTRAYVARKLRKAERELYEERCRLAAEREARRYTSPSFAGGARG